MSDGFSWTVNSDFALEEYIRFVRESYQKHKYVVYTWKFGKQRSLKQNSALHVYLKQLSKELNDAGYDMKKTLKQDVDIPWDDEGVMAKEHLWRPIQKALLDKDSTVEPEKMEYVKVYEVLNRHLASKIGVSVSWPIHDSR